MKWEKLKLYGSKTDYIISDHGDIINRKTGHEMKKYLHDGYIRSSLKSCKNIRPWNVARLMIETFRNESDDTKLLYFYDDDVTNLDLNNIKLVDINEYTELKMEKIFIKSGNNRYILNNDNINHKYKDEEWAQIIIDNNTSKYFISNHGRVLNSITNILLHPTIPKSTDNYPYITLRNNGNSYRFDIHILVAIYFVINDKPIVYKIVHHKNNNRHDFYYKNLEWTDSSGNMRYAAKEGRSLRGELAKNATITEETAIKICEMLTSGYRTCEITNTLNVSRNVVRHIRDEKTWTHISSQYDIKKYISPYYLTTTDIETVIKLFNDGKTYKEIQQLTQIGTNTLYTIKRRYLQTRTKTQHKDRVDCVILKLFNDGLELDKIEEITGFTKTYIMEVIDHFTS